MSLLSLINPVAGWLPDAANAAFNPSKPSQNPLSMSRAIDPKSKTVGGRTGIADYDGIGIADYNDPYDVKGFKGSKYYGIATGESMSPWSKLAAEQQNNLAAQGNASTKANAQGVAAKTASSLAQQGGLTSGARERAQETAGKNVLSMVQGNNQTAANNTANIGIEDAKQRMGMLGAATNKVTSMSAGNITGQNQYNQNIMSMLNQAVGANKSATAQQQMAQQQKYNDEHSGLFGNGGFLGLGL
jgi:hypothetical protein